MRLAHRRHQEDLVVHGQSEKHPDQQDRQEAEDRARLVDAEDRAAHTPLVDGYHGAEGGSDGQQEPSGGEDRHQQGAEHQEQQHQGQAHHHEQVQRQGVGQLLGDVDIGHRLTGEAQLGAVCLPDPIGRSIQVAHQVHGHLLGRPTLGHDLEGEGAPVLTDADRHHGFRTGHLEQLLPQLDLGLQQRQLGVLDRLVHGGHSNDRPVGAGTEVVPGQVVGGIRGGVLRLRGTIRQSQSDVEGGEGQGGHRGQHTQHREPGAALDPGGPPVPLPGRRGGVLAGGPLPSQDAGADQREQRRGQGDRQEHRDEHGAGGHQTHDAQEGDAGDHQRGQGDEDRHPSEDDSIAGGAGR